MTIIPEPAIRSDTPRRHRQIRLHWLALIGILMGCQAGRSPRSDDSSCGLSSDEAWKQWSIALRNWTGHSALPPIPVVGWQRGNGTSWIRDGAEVADFNLDGQVDYIRLVDPPGSYNHQVWVDEDRDGFLDRIPGKPLKSGSAYQRYPVPHFELAK